MASPKERILGAGPFRRVRTTRNPYDELDDALYTATDCYMEDPVSGGGVFARPGTVVWGPITDANPGQCVFSFTTADGSTAYNFFFIGGKVYRQATDLSTTPTDVTPTGVTIATSGRIFVTALADSIIVNDGANPPWLGTNLGGTPITGTTIPYQTAAVLLSIGSTDTRVANAAFAYLIAGTNYSKTATAAGTALPAGTIPTDTWGVYRASVGTTGTITFTAGAANYTTGYASEVLAIAALPATPANQWNMGYFTVQTATGQPFVAGTDALAGGVSGNPANATNYYAGDAPPWQAFGQPVIYTGAVFFILQTVEGVAARTTIAWSEPNQPGVGYQQTDYDNAWTLTQTSTDPLFALAATNDALYYSRRYSWGAITGAPNVNFQNTATHDVVSGNVGCVAPATVRTFLNYVYFCDQAGRPYRFAVGGSPEPIWRQASAVFESVSTASEVGTAWWAVVEPNLNVYGVLVGGAALLSNNFYVFDAATGIYLGSWNFSGGVEMDAGGIMVGTSAAGYLAMIQAGDGSNNHGLRKLMRVADGTWTDNGSVIAANVRTGPLGYNTKVSYTFPEIRAITGMTGFLTAPDTTLALTTSQGLSGGVVSGATLAQAPEAAFDGLWLTTWQTSNSGTNPAFGRDIRVLLNQPTNITNAQWRVFRIEVDAVEQGKSGIGNW